MANTRELRRRIRSVKNTSQITKAMQMVAATKMRKAQLQAENGRPYSQLLNLFLVRLTPNIHPNFHPFLRENDAKNIGIILLSTDKGLVGALNTNLLRLINTYSKDKPNVVFYTIGRKGRQYLVNTGKELAADFESQEVTTFRQARQLARVIKEAFLAGQLRQIFLAYPHFVSTLRQEPKLVKILPIEGVVDPQEQVKESKVASYAQFLFEPNPDELLEYVLGHSIETRIFQALLEAKASEHSARMIAMQNATDNAKELVQDLTLTYNQTRQQAITNELLEITTAGAALQ